MQEVILIHQEKIQHYRVSIYNYLSGYLEKNSIFLSVLSEGVQNGSPHTVKFNSEVISLNVISIICKIRDKKPSQIIFFVNPRNLYLFPVILYAKLKGIKTIYWGHGTDLENSGGYLKNGMYKFQHMIFDAMILYSDYLKKHINKKFYSKIFIANNTLNTEKYSNYTLSDKEFIKQKYNIKTDKNIVCVGRMQKRKRIHDLVEAYKLIGLKDIGLLLIGPDSEDVLSDIDDEGIYQLGEIYGEDVNRLLFASDVFCLPGHVGLSIVDAFYYGLPIITENVKHAPEIMYLKDGENGFVVSKGDVNMLAEKLRILLEDDSLRDRFSRAAKNEIQTNGSIENFCHGFLQAINYNRC